jgi:hypothetical protein
MINNPLITRLRQVRFYIFLVSGLYAFSSCGGGEGVQRAHDAGSATDTLGVKDSLRLAFKEIELPANYLELEEVVRAFDRDFYVLITSYTPGKITGASFYIRKDKYLIIANTGWSLFKPSLMKMNARDFFLENDTIKCRSIVVVDEIDSVIYSAGFDFKESLE